MSSIIDFKNNTIDIDYLGKIMSQASRFPERINDIFESMSYNQFLSKRELIDTLDNSGIVDENLNVIIIGSWYGTILVPILAPRVKSVSLYDIDKTTIHIARQLYDYKNIEYICKDPTKVSFERFKKPDTLIINTSCEHMESMKELCHTQKISVKKRNHKIYLACQSNDMFYIDQHINCVNNMEEFENQFPWNFQILYKKEIKEERGTRFCIFGYLEEI